MKQGITSGICAFVRFVPVYIVGFIIGVTLLILRVLRIWTIEGLKNLPSLREKGARGIMVVSNHPSLLEPIALIGLFFHWYIFRPFYGPWNMPDLKNYRRGLFRWMEPRLVFVDRAQPSSGRESFKKARDLLRRGSIFLLFPEGGRTFRGNPDELLHGKNGRKIRPFTAGSGLLATQTRAIVLPIWVEGTDAVSPNLTVVKYPFPRLWKPVKIRIGKSIVFGDEVRAKEATERLQTAVLEA